MIWISLIILTFSVNAQTTEQMRKWAFNGVEVDFTGATVTTQTISTPISSANGAYASYYDENNELVVRVVDNNVYDGDNNLVGSLFYDPAGDDLLTDQIVIAPQEHNNNCTFDIFYVVSVDNRDHLELRRAEYHTGALNIVDEELMYSWHPDYTKGTIVVSDFVNTSNERWLYMAVTSNTFTKSQDTIKIAFFKGPDWRGPADDIIWTACSSPASVGELELASDRSFIAYTRPFAHSGNHGQLMFHGLGYDGYFTQQTVHYDIDPSFTKHFAGLEISHDNNYAYVNSMGDRTYRIDVSDLNNVQNDGYFLNQNDYSYSQIERAHNNWYYMVKSDGNLGYFDANYFYSGMQPEVNIGSSAIINNAMHANDPLTQAAFNFYVIPDQMDGSEYDYTVNDDVFCCYDYNNTPADATMQGVQIQTSGDDRDIIIQSGNSVTWTATSNSFGNVAEAFMERGDIIIQPGASLTIEDMIIHFREGYEIQMDDNPSGVGSRLTLNNTTLTVFDQCEENAMWLGIDMNGGWGGQPQIPVATSHQPYLYMYNNSVISFAHIAIDAPAGGYVKSDNSSFINNVVSTSFTSYTDQHSLFKNCDFYWDDNLYANGLEASIHMHLWNASGVKMLGCDFRNDAGSNILMSDRGVGILADITDFEITGMGLGIIYPYMNFQRNNFNNLNYGIKSNDGNNIVIDRCNFTENQRGAWIIGSSALQFTRNDLDVYNTIDNAYFNNSFGLYLESCTGYQIEENDFHDGVIGLILYNSGFDVNEIYYNDFYNFQGYPFSISALGIGINGGAIVDQPNGVQFKCNDFDQTSYAIAVTGGLIQTQEQGLINIDYSAISWIQGQNNITNDLQSSLNTFWTHGLGGERDFYVDGNTSWVNLQGEKYKYNGSYDNLSNKDANINSFDSNEVRRAYYGTFTTREQECPSNLSSGGIIIIFPIRNSLDDKEAEQDSLETEYNALLADVNELELVIAAQTATDGNQQAVHNSLMEVSPNLTDTILISYLMNDNANELSRTSVMIANSPLPSSVKEDVEISNLSPELKYYISQYQTGVNRLENLENKIQMAKAARQYLTDRLQLEYVHNGTDEMQAEWLEYLEAKTDLHSKLKLTDMYIKQNQFNDAENLLANIESMLIGTENTEKLKQVRVKQISLAVRQNPQSAEIPASDLNYLYELAEDYSNKSGGDARAILMASGLESYEPIVILPDPNQEKSAIADNSHENIERPSITPELESRFDIFPNPVNDKLSVEFISMSKTCDFVVYDMNGKIVQQITRNEALGFFVLDVSSLKSGNYILYSPQLSEKKQFVVKR
ncbi:MAG: T9SS type A sorting domain-containing protein [Bacteroidales bacterium]|nr:T9SS type A sorting domain-containing protein [Bacteroidales bacterium]